MAISSAAERPVDEMSAVEVLAAARDHKIAADRAEAGLLVLACAWADQHPALDPADAASFWIRSTSMEEPISGPGTPQVAEVSIGEFGAVLGRSTDAAKRIIGHALELRHRLPRTWALIQGGVLPAWRGCRVAEATIHASPALSKEAAGWIDAQVAAVAGKVSPAQTDRLVEAAIVRFDLAVADPSQDPEDGWLHVDRRHATVHADHVSFDGTVEVTAALDLADATDLDQALRSTAQALKDLGCEASLDVRRSMAVGELARHQSTLDLTGATDGDVESPTWHRDPVLPTAEALAKARAATARQVVLYVHLAADAIGQVGSGTGCGLAVDDLGRLEQGQRLVLTEQVAAWCGQSATKVVVKPVVDLGKPLSAPGYAIPDRIREHVILRDGMCVFPYCTRPARRCDVDHVKRFDHDADAEGRPQPGPTATWNLVAVCRRHHRLKTPGRHHKDARTIWQLEMPQPGTVIWTSPHGHVFRRDRDGTAYLHGPDDPPAPDQRH